MVEGSAGSLATPFVGRDAELAALTADLDATAAGRGGVVLLLGGLDRRDAAKLRCLGHRSGVVDATGTSPTVVQGNPEAGDRFGAALDV